MSDSAPPGSSASTSGMLLGCCIARKAFGGTQRSPCFKSIVEKNLALTMDSIVPCIRGKGYESFLVLVFNCRKSIQNHRPCPSSRQELPHYTKRTGKAEWPHHPTFLGGVPVPHPGGAGLSAGTSL